MSSDIVKKHFTCVVCPVGCEVDVELRDGEVVSMTGNRCAKGKEFVLQELQDPMRMLTTIVSIKNARWAVLPVRSDRPIPRRLFFEAMKELAGVEPDAPVEVGDVVMTDVARTGVDMVATRSMKPSERPG
ncbi:MAG: DUF1667 domain-containing protein [Chloroflexota bacterium]